MNKKCVLNWINEFADSKPQNYQENFYEDIRDYVLNTDDSSIKMKNLFNCKNKEAVKKWLDNVCQYLIMNIDTESIIHEYFQ